MVLDVIDHLHLDIAVLEDQVGRFIHVIDAGDRNDRNNKQQGNDNAKAHEQAVADFEMGEIHFV